MEVFDDRACQLGEGPYYDDRTGRVGWVDILGRSVLWREPGSGERGALATTGHVGAAVPRAGGGLVLCLPAGPVLLDPDGGLRELGSFADADADADADRAAGRVPAAGAPALRANDAKADPSGRLWLGTMAYDQTPGAGALYRLEPGSAGPVRVLDGVTISNGLGWSPDTTRMYYVDTPTRRIDVFDYEIRRGALSGRRPFAEIEDGAGFPDGLCVDAAGGVWVALWQGSAVRRYAPDGTLDREVPVATPRVTSCAFAGPAYDRLIVTTASAGRASDPAAGLTYAYLPGDVTGRPPDRYAG
jgi:sugar lactone lactonase YvrE